MPYFILVTVVTELIKVNTVSAFMELKILGAEILHYHIYIKSQVVIGALNYTAKWFDERLKQDYLIHINRLKRMKRYQRKFL